MNLPTVVSAQEWQAARDALLVREKELTRAMDAVNRRRRELPMTPFDGVYRFDGPAGEATLLDMFEGRRQLIVYHFMMEPGDDHRCPGCSLVADNIGNLAHLHARDTTLVLVSPAPRSQTQPFQRRMGWTVPWYSTLGDDFYTACGVGRGFGLSVFLRDGDQVYRTYFTTGRGGDQLDTTLRYLDLTPFGRQENWELPAGRGRGDAPSTWWRLHDEYDR